MILSKDDMKWLECRKQIHMAYLKWFRIKCSWVSGYFCIEILESGMHEVNPYFIILLSTLPLFFLSLSLFPWKIVFLLMLNQMSVRAQIWSSLEIRTILAIHIRECSESHNCLSVKTKQCRIVKTKQWQMFPFSTILQMPVLVGYMEIHRSSLMVCGLPLWLMNYNSFLWN